MTNPLNPPSETLRRVKRTMWQALAAGVVTGPLVAWLTDDIRALLVALATAASTVLATWAQNVLEDGNKIRDRR